MRGFLVLLSFVTIAALTHAAPLLQEESPPDRFSVLQHVVIPREEEYFAKRPLDYAEMKLETNGLVSVEEIYTRRFKRDNKRYEREERRRKKKPTKTHNTGSQSLIASAGNNQKEMLQGSHVA
nr:PREDICTED: uncharacterized protein LOC106706817 [Latimeria chalumnae]|eukprot:XP_014353752.1 PREDICTED: uncharacterized protein LOC106706817 [Latimeria chalumnae]